ncbi:hypothetical protein [Goodfellowiella coeruleoviolacea]|uniref:Uncharacterized protein n=1 Tax=Goodfellowiella coeruleoviolacea TaxID=334858 RepID=A0AAE3GMU9_9PSEU|nr:hypothetical protein [Goodfellowiella coeruleoviolacea]MCP2170430.1 hypothetical protein [Goodfellowiella coeruleoviolacea]
MVGFTPTRSTNREIRDVSLPDREPSTDGWNLHALRHSRLTHSGEDGLTGADLMNLSGHEDRAPRCATSSPPGTSASAAPGHVVACRASPFGGLSRTTPNQKVSYPNGAHANRRTPRSAPNLRINGLIKRFI